MDVSSRPDTSAPAPLEQDPGLRQYPAQQISPPEPEPPRASSQGSGHSSACNHAYSQEETVRHVTRSTSSAPQDPEPEDDRSSQFASPATSSQPQPSQTDSRPGSGLSTGGDRFGYSSPHQEQIPRQPSQPAKNSVVIKVGMVGDAQIGKTSLMVKYVEGSWDEDYIQTLGVNFMEKTISIRNTEITFSIWDLGGQREFVNMLPLVCNDAVAILFMFDLTRKSTLNSIKEWYRQGRGFNKTAIPLLVGTKYDQFVNFPREDQEEISLQAKRFAKAMRASLIFSSTSHSINVQKIFKIVLSKAFDLKCTIPEIENIGEPLLLYKNV
ncbi:hypothetical protein VTN31DRAFT_3220 [Thermomyces dupontii]|uniref:uncharacterized protein n=1 Tax=Talaromyces thermophilus TaxID=28565 RepID=UPI0037443013